MPTLACDSVLSVAIISVSKKTSVKFIVRYDILEGSKLTLMEDMEAHLFSESAIFIAVM